MTTTRFLNGLNTEADNSIFKELGRISPTTYHAYFNDFDTYAAGDWHVVETDGSATQALADGDGGILALTTTTTNPDKVQLQLGGSGINGFSFTAGKKSFFEVRFKLSAVTSCTFLAGLYSASNSALDPADGVYFSKATGAATTKIWATKNQQAAGTSATATTLVADTYTKLSWYYDGVDKIYYAVDGVVLGSLDGSSTYLPDAATAVSLLVATTGTAHTLSVDYVFAAKQR